MDVYKWINKQMQGLGPYTWSYAMKNKLYYYRSKRLFPMMLLGFRNIAGMYTFKKMMSTPQRIPDIGMISCNVWENDVSSIRRMLTLRKCSFAQWFSVSGQKVAPEDKISSLPSEYLIDWRTINPLSNTETVGAKWQTSPKIVSYDIEAYSENNRAMPSSLNTNDVSYIITVVFQLYNKPESRKRYTLVYVPDDPLLRKTLDEFLVTKRQSEIILYPKEIDMIDGFAELVTKLNPEIVIGYNILGFDYPYLTNRLKSRLREWQVMGRLKEVRPEMTVKRWQSSAYGHNEIHILRLHGRISIDLLPVIRREYTRLPKYDLDTVSKEFLKRGKHDVKAKRQFEIKENLDIAVKLCNFSPPTGSLSSSLTTDQACETVLRTLFLSDEDQFGRMCVKISAEQRMTLLKYAVREFLRVMNYAVEDSELVIDLFHKLNLWFASLETSSIEGVNIIDLSTRGQQIRGFSQMFNLAANENTVIDHVQLPKMPYKGALVGDPIPGLYPNILTLDFASLYPSIIQAYNICWSTYVTPEDTITPDSDCHVFEWDEEIDGDTEGGTTEDDPENVDPDTGAPLKKSKKQTVHHRHRFVKKEVKEGLLPRLVASLVAERRHINNVLIPACKDPTTKKILNARQLAIKVYVGSARRRHLTAGSRCCSCYLCWKTVNHQSQRVHQGEV
jgi:DNA polymerase elongation subunit (family B)